MHHPTRVALAAVTVSALAATLSAPWAAAAPSTADGVVATGLNNPRHLTIGPGNRIYVAESGTGAVSFQEADRCIANPENPEERVCLGLTGSITEVDGTKQTRVVTGLPSLAGNGGAAASGPADVDVRGNNVAVLIGLGGNEAARASLGPDAETLGTLRTGRLGGPLSTAADLVAHEERHDPDEAGSDSNPGGLLATDAHNWVVADAGGNDLVGVGKRGERTIAVLPGDRTAPVPFPGPWGPPGSPIPFQSVPTDVVQGPDGSYYVAELTGFPFPAGASTIWKVTRSGETSAYATGLTNVTSLDWRGNQLYAVQLTDDGMLSTPEGELPNGSVRRVIPGATAHPAVVSGLPAPYGIAIRGNTAYVTTGSVLPGGGEVRAVALR